MRKYSISRTLFFSIGLFTATTLYGQEEEVTFTKDAIHYYQYDQDFLPASFHKARRDSLRELLPDSTAAVFFSAPERNRSNDVYYEYHQDPNFYYLTGLREPNSMVIIYKEEQLLDSRATNEVLFIQDRSPASELWNGRRIGKAGAEASLEFISVVINKDFLNFDPKFSSLKKVYYQKPHALEELDSSTTDNLNGLFVQFKNKAEALVETDEKKIALRMAKLRQVKTQKEIDLIKKAIDITCEAQNNLMKQITAKMTEYQTEAITEYTFKSNGAEYTGFPSIQGSGENSCILHYTSNRRPLKNGGLLVSDVGAEYRGYSADVSRTIPPTGKFSEEEKIIYKIVLDAQKAGIDSCKVGNSFWSAHIVAKRIIAAELIKLKIIKNERELSKYFPHGTSHYLGLDVHDAGIYSLLEEGNVITVEPGIYIAEGSDCDPKWWNIGVRIEDDILITKEGPVNLSSAAPKEIMEIETLMSK